MNLREIQQTIRCLPHGERERLVAWLAGLWESESRAGTVGEARMPCSSCARS